MSYEDLYKIENIQDKNKRLIEYAKHYQTICINGLHYVNFDKESNTISISHPNHRTHHLATTFLIKQKEYLAINTVRSYASNLKKFLDFLLIWKIDLNKCDLLILVSGFVSYLRCIDSSTPPFSNTMIYYSSLSKIPLNNSATSCGKVIHLSLDAHGIMRSNQWTTTVSRQTIVDSLLTTLKYLKFVKESTQQYKTINYNEIPTKAVASQSMVSGTVGKHRYDQPHIDAILNFAGLKEETVFNSSVSNLMVLSLEEVDQLISVISPQNRRDLLLFHVMKCFGLREGEATGLQVDTSLLSHNYMYTDKELVKSELREKLRGDITYSHQLQKWTCSISKHTSGRFDRQAKTGSRTIPLLFPENIFEDILLYGLIHREIIMKQANKKHNYLFINIANKKSERGNPIAGSTVYTRFKALAERLKDKQGVDLTNYSPHSIRHFFATHMIKSKKFSVLDVSKLLGHSGEETTLNTYYHFFERDTLKENESKKILNKLKEHVNENE